jgi:hypothetical protein
MSNNQTYAVILSRFKTFAESHKLIKQFTHGQIENMDTDKFPEYPLMHFICTQVTYPRRMKRWSITVLIMDLPRDKEDETGYQAESLSETQLIVEDLVASLIMLPLFNEYGALSGDPLILPLLKEDSNTLTGWQVQFNYETPWTWDNCNLPSSLIQ